jgi:hypothetical protein
MERRRDDLDAQLDHLQKQLPAFMAGPIRFLRRPGMVWIRIPAGLLLIAGGVLAFLPLLGVWMIPLGLALIAVDVPFLRGPVARAIAWGEDKAAALKNWWRGETAAERRN